MAVEDESKKYYEPKAEGERHFWRQHIVQRYTQPGIPEHQFTGGIDKDGTRSADVPDGRISNPLTTVDMPHYMSAITKAIAGIREAKETLDRDANARGKRVKVHAPGYPSHGKEGVVVNSDSDGSFHVIRHDDGTETSHHGDDLKPVHEAKLDEAFPPKKDGDDKDPKKKDKKKKPNPFAKDGDDDGKSDTDGDGEDDDEEVDNDEDENAPPEPEKDTDIDDNAGGENITGGDVKQQLEQIALQAAEMFAECDEKQVFSTEVRDALETAIDSIGTVHASVMKEKEAPEEDENKDVQNTPNKPDVTSSMKESGPTWVTEISRNTMVRYRNAAIRDGYDKKENRDKRLKGIVTADKKIEKKDTRTWNNGAHSLRAPYKD